MVSFVRVSRVRIVHAISVSVTREYEMVIILIVSDSRMFHLARRPLYYGFPMVGAGPAVIAFVSQAIRMVRYADRGFFSFVSAMSRHLSAVHLSLGVVSLARIFGVVLMNFLLFVHISRIPVFAIPIFASVNRALIMIRAVLCVFRDDACHVIADVVIAVLIVIGTGQRRVLATSHVVALIERAGIIVVARVRGVCAFSGERVAHVVGTCVVIIAVLPPVQAHVHIPIATIYRARVHIVAL